MNTLLLLIGIQSIPSFSDPSLLGPRDLLTEGPLLKEKRVQTPGSEDNTLTSKGEMSHCSSGWVGDQDRGSSEHLQNQTLPEDKPPMPSHRATPFPKLCVDFYGSKADYNTWARIRGRVDILLQGLLEALCCKGWLRARGLPGSHHLPVSCLRADYPSERHSEPASPCSLATP